MEKLKPPLPPVSPLVASSTHPSKSVVFLVSANQQRAFGGEAAQRRPVAARQRAAAGAPAPPRPTWLHPSCPAYLPRAKKQPPRLEPLQNAASRKLLAMYYEPQAVRANPAPVDWRNGLDMRSLAPAQDPSYLYPRETNTFETNKHSTRPLYEGGLQNQLRHGYGKCQFNNAAYAYEGEWAQGRMHGQGKLQLPDGFYDGEFCGGEISGSGIRCWHDGSQYTGEFLDGEMHGQGLLLRADGERYEGGFRRNQRSGQGILVLPDGTRYEGYFEEHRLNGHGIMEQVSGDRYEGDWCNGNMDGSGEYWHANGDHYIGRYARNMREGHGVLFLAASGIKLDCDWERDLPVVLPARLTVESPDRLFWSPPTPAPVAEAAAEGEAPATEEEESQPQAPPSLKEQLAEPVAPGSVLPPLVVTVEGLDVTGRPSQHDIRAVPRAQTPGGGVAGTVPQLGESGRLLAVTFGIFEREELPEAPPPAEGEEPAERPPGPFKCYPTQAFAIHYQPTDDVAAAEQEAGGPEEGGGDRWGREKDDTVLDDADRELLAGLSRPAAAVGEGEQDAEGGEGADGEEESGAATLQRMLAAAPALPFPKEYPPSLCLGGIKRLALTDGRVTIHGLRLPDTTPPGTYQLCIRSQLDLPWGEPVEAAYLEITVQ